MMNRNQSNYCKRYILMFLLCVSFVTITATTSTSSTSLPSTTTETTVSASTTPTPCLNNRTSYGLFYSSCGVHSSAAICGTPGTACQRTVQDPDDWRCLCAKGYIRYRNDCYEVRSFSDLFESEASKTVPIWTPLNSTIDVYSFRFPVHLIMEKWFCRVSHPEVFSCSVNGIDVKILINTFSAYYAEDLSYRVFMQTVVQLDGHLIYDEAILNVDIIKPPIRLSTMIVDTSLPGQFVIHVPVRTNESLVLNSTYFKLNNKMDILVSSELSTMYPESTVFYSLLVSVTEMSGRPFAIVDIFVIRDMLSASVPENTMPIIASVNRHNDVNVIIHGPNNDSFSILNNSISLMRQSDFEQMSLNELAIDVVFIENRTGREAICAIKVEIANVDDVGPRFPINITTVSITQSALETFVMNLNAYDVDTDNLMFTLPPLTRDFIIKRGNELWKTSAENSSSVSVTVTDGTNGDDVLLVLVDVQRPVSEALNNTFKAEIGEERPIGTWVTSVNITGYIDYQFLDSRALEYFRLDNFTGRVTLNKKIDRESDMGLSEDRLIFPVRGTEKGTSCSFVNIGKLSVLIKDINDNPPVFKHDTYSGSVVEAKNGAYVEIQPLIEIQDKDLGSTNIFTFSLLNFQNYFQIEYTSGEVKIITNREIDRESGTTEFPLQIKVSDSNNSAIANLSVRITDINDNIPEYKNASSSFSVLENATLGTIITKLLFEDKDEGMNGEISFTDNNGYFYVDDSGELRVDGPLDREKLSMHKLSVTACDKAEIFNCSVVTLEINIVDVNDNAPVFMSPSEFITVREDAPCSSSSPIATVVFRDDDANNYGLVDYKIKSSGIPIGISSSTGSLYCQGSLDYENESSPNMFEVGIEACDGGNPPKCTTETINIKVTDVNDNAPVFHGDFAEALYSLSVELRDFDKSKPIALVSVTDEDSGDNGKVSFVNHSGDGWRFMQINKDNGLISTISSAEKPKDSYNYTLVIMVKDHGIPQMSSTVTIYYTVATEQGIVEFIDNDIQVNVEEESLQINIVLSQYITNSSGINVKYDIPGVDQAVDFAFQVEETSGRISLKKKLDREIQDQHLFPVRAFYDKSSTLALVTINVLDINDNGPVFPSTLVKAISFYENASLGSMILNISAHDADSDQNAVTSYRLKPVSQTAYCAYSFSINSTGELILVQYIDYDYLQYNGGVTYCHFEIEAIDVNNPSLHSKTSLTVEVLDVNDNAPEIVGGITDIVVPENSPTTSEFSWRTIVTDKDMKGSQNGDFDVAISNPEDCPFSVKASRKNNNDKVVSFQPKPDADLDYESIQFINCVLTITDKGDKPLSTSINVSIHLKDVNDNEPEVIGGPYTTNISRYAEKDEVIFPSINASDRDSGLNSRLQFTKDIAGTAKNAWDFFYLSPSTGQISVFGSLPSLSTDVAVLSVMVSDMGSPARSIKIRVMIYMEDDNQRPYFIPDQLTITVTEETQYTQAMIKNIQALDKEKTSTIQCNCIYNITSYHDLFYLRYTSQDGTALVLRNTTLDREVEPYYIVEIAATDKGEPPKTTDKPLRILVNLTDLNDNAPRFKYPIYETSIFQDYPVGKSFFQVVAIDLDLGYNAVTKYSLTGFRSNMTMDSAQNTSLFAIDSDSGYLSLTSPATFNTTDTYYFDLTVKATDAGKSIYTDVSTVRVYVTYKNPNHHPPVFNQDIYRTTIDLTTINVNAFILKMSASDNETNEDIIYRIQSGNIRDTFSLNPTNGELSLKYPLDDTVKARIKNDQLMLRIIAVDGDVLPKTGTATVYISVEGVAMPCKVVSLSDQSTYQTVMYVLIAVTCVLLITNAIFISLYCRRKPQRLRRGDPYSIGDKRVTSKHEYDSSIATWQHQQWNETDNQAYNSNQQLLSGNNGFSDALQQRLNPAMTSSPSHGPPALPQRPTGQGEPVPDY